MELVCLRASSRFSPRCRRKEMVREIYPALANTDVSRHQFACYFFFTSAVTLSLTIHTVTQSLMFTSYYTSLAVICGEIVKYALEEDSEKSGVC